MILMSYSIFFDYNDKTYRLPVNPEEIEVTSKLSVEKYEILKLGQIAIPTHMELKEYSFSCELPKEAYSYVETPNEFKNADYYLKEFEKWRSKKRVVRFIAKNEIGEDINTPVLIDSLVITERAGEEGDKYVSFHLIEYVKYGKEEPAKVNPVNGKKEESPTEANPKSNGYHIVKGGDTLWGIAKKYYGDGTKSNIIFNANKDKIKNPNEIKIGQKLVIPDTDAFSKYSAPLPKMKVSSSTKKEATNLLANKGGAVGSGHGAGNSFVMNILNATIQ